MLQIAILISCCMLVLCIGINYQLAVNFPTEYNWYTDLQTFDLQSFKFCILMLDRISVSMLGMCFICLHTILTLLLRLVGYCISEWLYLHVIKCSTLMTRYFS